MDAAQLGRITVGLVPQKEQVLLSPGKKSRDTALFSLFFLPGDIKDLILESLIKSRFAPKKMLNNKCKNNESSYSRA